MRPTFYSSSCMHSSSVALCPPHSFSFAVTVCSTHSCIIIAGRVVVPGHVGIRNVKWLSKITLSDEEAHGVSDVTNSRRNQLHLFGIQHPHSLLFSLVCLFVCIPSSSPIHDVCSHGIVAWRTRASAPHCGHSRAAKGWCEPNPRRTCSTRVCIQWRYCACGR